VITPCAIRAAALWVALCAARSVGLSLAELWMEAEGPAGAPGLVRSSVARRAAFKGLRCSTAPMHVACVVDGPNGSGYGARGRLAARTRCPLWVQKQTFAPQIVMSAFPPRADISGHDWNVS
jgi:hypothetical protein